MKIHLRIEGLNCEPWTSPEGSVGRKGGKFYVQMHKAQQLSTYQEAIASAVQASLPEGFVRTEEPLEVEFRFWRQLPVYERAGKKVRKHRCDATNAQKALEDALQGILFKNDSQVIDIRSIVVDQDVDVEPRIEIDISTIDKGAGPGWYSELYAEEEHNTEHVWIEVVA